METIQRAGSPYEAVVAGLVLALTAPDEERASRAAALAERIANAHLTLQQVDDAKWAALRQTNLHGDLTGEED